MKMKLAMAVLSAATMLSAAAQANTVCPFTDHFFVKGPLPLHVMSVAIDGNLSFTSMNDDYFRLSCKDVRVFSGGVATLDIGMQPEIKCTLKIQDGPYQMNPTVTDANCGGPHARIYFIGMDHPYGSHDYFLKFTM